MDSFVQIVRCAWMRTRAIIVGGSIFAGVFVATASAQTSGTPPTSTQPAATPAGEKSEPPIALPPAARPAEPAKVADAPPTGDVGWLRVTGNSVNVRSRPDVNSLAVTRVTRDTLLQSVGKEFGWYAIKPPPEVFSMICARFHDEAQKRDIVTVERQGDTAIIRVDADSTLRVRAGSRVVNADPEHVDVQTRLKSGERVKVIGEDGDWLKIVPPDGVKVYIKDEFVQRISDAEAMAAGGVSGAKLAPAEGTTATPAVRPAAGWAAQLKTIEGKIDAESRKPALEQGWPGLVTELKPVSDQRDDPVIAGSATRLIDNLQDRIRTQDSLRVGSGLSKKDGAELASSIEKAVEAPSNATTMPAQPAATPVNQTTPISQITVPVVEPKPEREGFDAEGELQPSYAVPAGKDGLRYRLLDPGTRATRAYVEFPWTISFKATDHIGRYVGVQGERSVDMQKEISIWRASRVTVLTPDKPVAQPRTNP